MRLFVAVALPAGIAEAAARLLPRLAALRAVRPEAMHVTLAFIGSLPEARLGEAVAAVDTAGARGRAFAASLGALGRFPERGAPQVLWLGVDDGAAELAALASSVRAELALRGLPFDAKPFRPHVTLARVRDGAAPSETAEVARAAGAMLVERRFVVTRLLLLESTLAPGGPRYTPRTSVPLAVGDA